MLQRLYWVSVIIEASLAPAKAELGLRLRLANICEKEGIVFFGLTL
jgi:hypothetical protein